MGDPTEYASVHLITRAEEREGKELAVEVLRLLGKVRLENTSLSMSYRGQTIRIDPDRTFWLNGEQVLGRADTLPRATATLAVCAANRREHDA